MLVKVKTQEVYRSTLEDKVALFPGASRSIGKAIGPFFANKNRNPDSKERNN
jgi:hypothetical protein